MHKTRDNAHNFNNVVLEGLYERVYDITQDVTDQIVNSFVEGRDLAMLRGKRKAYLDMLQVLIDADREQL